MSERERCPRDSDWCDGVICANLGFPDCPNADTQRNDDPEHIAAVTAIAESRGCIGPFPCGRDIPEFGGRDAACDCEDMVTRMQR
jgi:hypothetical protein